MLILPNRTTGQMCRDIPESLVLFMARFALAAVFWLSGQTKIEGLALNPFAGLFEVGWPSIKESTFYLFEHEYALPIIPPEMAAYMATFAEHLLPLMLLFGIFTRLGAAGVLLMTLVIQTFVYPEAYALHATWAALALLLIKSGGGKFSLDALITRPY
ncbi:DoxX [Marinomonas aquimarina]|uniref:DoxX n=1 Tax=Marinomonas aquimarina TaxID=295068 RepID=A0A1A8T9X5_9GAMM|nr:DoxX family protein [Marinomonas aquimarina]SBS29598.1 DoxX [Marinomonas aquimarina]